MSQRRSLLQAQDMTGSVIHLLVARSGIDGKLLIHQLDDCDRGGISLLSFDRSTKPRLAWLQHAACTTSGRLRHDVRDNPSVCKIPSTC